jgi:hypothetical protein
MVAIAATSLRRHYRQGAEKVAGRDDSDWPSLLIDYGHARDVMIEHQPSCLLDRGVGPRCNQFPRHDLMGTAIQKSAVGRALVKGVAEKRARVLQNVTVGYHSYQGAESNDQRVSKPMLFEEILKALHGVIHVDRHQVSGHNVRDLHRDRLGCMRRALEV